MMFIIVCPSRYKTRPGLDYHMSHCHHYPREESFPQQQQRPSHPNVPVQLPAALPGVVPGSAATAADIPQLPPAEFDSSQDSRRATPNPPKVKNPVSVIL